MQEEAEEILRRAQHGDQKSFGLLTELHRKTVTRFVYRLVGNASAEDIISETFLALHLNLARLTSAESVKMFLYRVARNRAYDILRHQGRFEIVNFEAEPVSHHPLPEKELNRLALWSELYQAIDRLPEMQRQSLILYAEEGLTYTQIAELLDVDMGTIRSRLFQARRNLMRYLHPDTLIAFGLPAEPTKEER